MQMGLLPAPGLIGAGRLDQERPRVDRQRGQERLCRIFQGEFDRVRIERLHRLDDLEVWAGEGLLLRVHDAFKVPGHGSGVEVGAVMEFHPLAQPEHYTLPLSCTSQDSASSGT